GVNSGILREQTGTLVHQPAFTRAHVNAVTRPEGLRAAPAPSKGNHRAPRADNTGTCPRVERRRRNDRRKVLSRTVRESGANLYIPCSTRQRRFSASTHGRHNTPRRND